MKMGLVLPGNFADEVATICYEHFKRLPRKGKPQLNKEWTLLAAIVLSYDNTYQKLKVVSLSTGTKCLGYSQLTDKGNLVFDSHAEVLARRAFLRFLYENMSLALRASFASIFEFDESKVKFTLKPGIQFHFFISHVPCGDAAIFPKANEQCLSSKHEQSDLTLEPKCKKLKSDTTNLVENSLSSLSSDIYRTGAKCVEKGLQDPKTTGKDYHVIGALRTKPGRGDPTWSMSCSDKIALWNICGLQGALISHLLINPIYMTSYIFGKCPFSRSAIKRAIIERLSHVTSLPSSFKRNEPIILSSTLSFENSKENMTKINSKVVPCPASLIWSDIPNSLEVSVNGRKQGVTKKNLGKLSASVGVCKQLLFKRFLELLKEMPSSFDKSRLNVNECSTYLDYKKAALSYQEAKLSVFKVFCDWKKKPDHFQNFVYLEKE